MIRPALTALLGAGLILSATLAQDPKPKEATKVKKAAPRIAIDEPEKLKDDAQFKLQGEYVSKASKDNSGWNFIALGDNKFSVKFFKGGLPGDGWDGKETQAGTAELNGDQVTLKINGQESRGTVKDGSIELSNGMISIELKKVLRKSKTLGEKPPEGAVVLFAGPGDEAKWNNGKLIKLSDGEFLNYGIKSKATFQSFKMHIEFRLPWMPNSRGQGRANSGLYLQDRYEVQILDSFGLKGENNECGGIYQQYKPLVNMCYPPMQWQTYDVEFTAAKFDTNGKKTTPAKLTLYHNGVLIHDGIEFKGPTGGGQGENTMPGPLQLQNHGDPLVFRNIWVVETK